MAHNCSLSHINSDNIITQYILPNYVGRLLVQNVYNIANYTHIHGRSITIKSVPTEFKRININLYQKFKNILYLDILLFNLQSDTRTSTELKPIIILDIIIKIEKI